MNDAVNHPSHYTYGRIESIEYIDSCGFGLHFCLGNVLKYVSRAEHKGNPVEDLQKARWYLDHAISLYDKDSTNFVQNPDIQDSQIPVRIDCLGGWVSMSYQDIYKMIGEINAHFTLGQMTADVVNDKGKIYYILTYSDPDDKDDPMSLLQHDAEYNFACEFIKARSFVVYTSLEDLKNKED